MKLVVKSTGCVISLGTEFQMDVAQKWAKPRPQKFLQLFTILFGSFSENLEILAWKNIHLWYQIGQKISLKKGVFGTTDLFIEISLEWHKNTIQSLLSSTKHYFWVNLWNIKCKFGNHIKNIKNWHDEFNCNAIESFVLAITY